MPRSRWAVRDAGCEPGDPPGPESCRGRRTCTGGIRARLPRAIDLRPAASVRKLVLSNPHNVTVDYLRPKRLTTVSLDEWEELGYPGIEPASAETAPDVLAEQAAVARAVDAALYLIRPEYREAVVLRYHEDLSVQEIAEIMAVPAGTVKTYLFRARKELASILSARGWIPAGTGAG